MIGNNYSEITRYIVLRQKNIEDLLYEIKMLNDQIASYNSEIAHIREREEQERRRQAEQEERLRRNGLQTYYQ